LRLPQEYRGLEEFQLFTHYVDWMSTPRSGGEVTFLSQKAPVDERGRALYAVARSVLRAHLDQLNQSDLEDFNCDRADVTFRQLSKVARLHRDKGMRGDGFEWAIHEALVGLEPSVVDFVQTALAKASPKAFKTVDTPTSLMFGYERAKYLGFLDAVVDSTADDALLLPEGSGRPFGFGTWVSIAAKGKAAEPLLQSRIKSVWKTDLFLGDEDRRRHLAATIKSNWHQLESGPGLRLGIVPEAADLRPGVRFQDGLWLAILPDPDGFMGLFNDAYESVAEAIVTVGKHDRSAYYYKPTPMGQRIQTQLEKYEKVKVVEIEHALDEASQQDLIGIETRLVSVDAPEWLHLNATRTPVIAPRPSFRNLGS
jgi:hypothetical protein